MLFHLLSQKNSFNLLEDHTLSAKQKIEHTLHLNLNHYVVCQ
uniref:Uncharacterized protein n=1 Tax=Anguilla anguilla TaxID=7936 RepID=A0A0E9PQX3_ANGAN